MVGSLGLGVSHVHKRACKELYRDAPKLLG